MTTKHTPGPWYPNRNSSFWEVNTSPEYYSPTILYVWPTTGDDAEAKATAHLAAAAPALLEALELGYLALLKQPFPSIWRIHNQHVFAAMRDAIAGATGQDAETVQNHFEVLAQGAK